jgi:hypothetical protein
MKSQFSLAPVKTPVLLGLLQLATLIMPIEVALTCVPAAASSHEKYAPYSEARTNLEAAILSTSDRVVTQVQVKLRNLGYDPGHTPGFLGEKTQIAIQMFEVDHCYPVRPEINRRFLIWLGIRD